MTDRTDNFNRSDRSLSGDTPSDGGSAWVVHAGTWNILNNAAYKPSNFNTNECCSIESSVSNVDVQTTHSLLGNGGVAVRIADNNNYLLAAVLSTQATMYKRVAGTATQLGSTYSGNTAAGDVWKFTANGTSLTMSQNGTSRITATDGAGQSNTKHGLYDFSSATGTYDQFSITGLGGSTFIAAKPMIISQAIRASTY